METGRQERLDKAIARLRAGEVLRGSFMHDHGLQVPLVACSSLRFEQGAFVYRTWAEEPVLPVVELQAQVQRLDEAGARAVLERDRGLQEELGR